MSYSANKTLFPNNMSMTQELSMGQLFQTDDYLIPLYQRNYAWEQAQVTQLIRDIWDLHADKGNYYVGTLVTHLTEHDGRPCYETIDGQQRLTTLNILFSVLKQDFGCEIDYRYETRLRFESRAVSSQTLKALCDNGADSNKIALNTKMSQAYINMGSEIRTLANGDRAKISQFKNYLFQNVKLLRVVVPPDTDLNHYFEIMNNRGEQLEMHEIQKSRFLKLLKGDDLSSRMFSRIWEACSMMGQYMVFGFEKPLRDALFQQHKSWDYFHEDFEELCERANLFLYNKIKSSSPKNLLNLIRENAPDIDDEEEETVEKPETYNSVVDFPNFLLHVLRVWTGSNVRLDDKKLLNTFADHIAAAKDKARFAKDFAYELLHARFMFDRYIIKRPLEQGKEDWSMESLHLMKDRKRSYYVNTFDTDSQDQVIKLLSMFHVSFPQMIYKHWLSGVMKFLYDSEAAINGQDYISYLERLSDAFYFDRFGPKVIDYYDIIFKKETETD